MRSASSGCRVPTIEGVNGRERSNWSRRAVLKAKALKHPKGSFAHLCTFCREVRSFRVCFCVYFGFFPAFTACFFSSFPCFPAFSSFSALAFSACFSAFPATFCHWLPRIRMVLLMNLDVVSDATDSDVTIASSPPLATSSRDSSTQPYSSSAADRQQHQHRQQQHHSHPRQPHTRNQSPQLCGVKRVVVLLKLQLMLQKVARPPPPKRPFSFLLLL